jgi:hypothetical protein
MKRYFFISVMVAICSNAAAFEVKIGYPDNEVKTFGVFDDIQPLDMRAAKWSCSAVKNSPPNPNGFDVMCEFGKTAAKAAISVTCTNSNDGAVLHLYDGPRKHYRLMATCK